MCKKNRFVRLIAIVLIGIILITIVSCKSKDDQASNYVNNENANIADADCIINGQEIYFVSDESKKEWEKPLAIWKEMC